MKLKEELKVQSFHQYHYTYIFFEKNYISPVLTIKKLQDLQDEQVYKLMFQNNGTAAVTKTTGIHTYVQG